MARPRSRLLSIVVVFMVLALVGAAVVPEASQAKRGQQRVGAKVVNGSDVPDGQFPFVAAVGYADPSGAFLWDNMFCGGSLVAPDLVLTAAHCVLGTTAGELAVVVGRTLQSSDQGQVRTVSQILMDPDFNHAKATNDMALLRLNQPVTGIDPIKVIGDSDTSFGSPGTPLTLVGWGDTLPPPHGGKPDVYPDRLQQDQVNVVDDNTCAKQWRRTGFSDNSVWGIILCTTPGVFGPGDSGSPLFVSTPSGYVQVSLVSGSYAKHNKNRNENKKNKSHKSKHNNGKGGKKKGKSDNRKNNNDNNNNGKKNKKKQQKLHQQIPDYGPELSARISASFLTANGV